jgi:hypothetical protein
MKTQVSLKMTQRTNKKFIQEKRRLKTLRMKRPKTILKRLKAPKNLANLKSTTHLAMPPKPMPKAPVPMTTL